MLATKMEELLEKGYRIEFKPLDSLFQKKARVKVRLAKDDYNVVDVIDLNTRHLENLLTFTLDGLAERYEVEHA